MGQGKAVLIVSESEKRATRFSAMLANAGYRVTIADTFDAAKKQLALGPRLVITDLKLGAYNGLHVALRAKVAGTPTIVLGPPDSVLSRDAAALDAIYLPEEAPDQEILEMAEQLLDEKRRSGNGWGMGLALVWNLSTARAGAGRRTSFR